MVFNWLRNNTKSDDKKDIWLQVNIWKIIHLNCGQRYEDIIDNRSHVHILLWNSQLIKLSQEPITRSQQLPSVISQCNRIFTDQSFFRYFFPRNRPVPVVLRPSLRRRANARTLRWLTYIVNSVDKTKLSSSSLHEHASASIRVKQCGLTWEYRHVNISPCWWLQLVTEVPVGIWIRDKFKLKIDRSVKTPWQEYGVDAGSTYIDIFTYLSVTTMLFFLLYLCKKLPAMFCHHRHCF